MTQILSKEAQSTARRFIKNILVIDNEIHNGNCAIDSFIHPLNAKILTDAFASQNYLCSTITPDNVSIMEAREKDFSSRYAKLVLSSDVAILDWQMTTATHGDKAILCKNIVKYVVTEEKGIRPRLIIIYTGEAITDGIVDSLVNSLPKQYKSKVHKDNAEFGFNLERLRIVFVGKKEESTNDIPLVPGNAVKLSDLPHRVAEYFAPLTEGLLPTAVFNSIAAIRENTGHFLATFHRELDPAFLHHLLLRAEYVKDTSTIINQIEDGAWYISAQIADELSTVLSNDRIFKWLVSADVLREWRSTDTSFLKSALTDDEYSGLLNLSQPQQASLTKSKYEKKTNNLRKIQNKCLIEFARIADLKIEHCTPTRISTQDVPYLTYGTLLKELKSTCCYICIIPSCDSVRLDTIREFPFLKLQSISDASEACFCCFDGQDIFTELPSKDMWKHIEVLKFGPDPESRRVKATKVNNDFQFFSVDHKKFKWLAELKPSAMGDIHKKVFPDISRIGTDTFEWLRKKRNKS